MDQNTQQHGTRNDVKRVNRVDLSCIQNLLQENAQQITTLTTLVSKIVASNESKARVCEICCNESHTADKYPDLQYEDVNFHHNKSLNPNGHVKAVTLRSGKELTEPKMKSREVEKEIEVSPKVGSRERVESEKENAGKGKTESASVVSRFKDLPPFTSRFSKAKKESLDNEILETFRKIEVNIPLLDAIEQVPRYAKFLKEFILTKGSFILLKRCMLDLGASVNVMPKSVYDTLNVGSLSKTHIVIQLADRSNTFSIGVLEDVLVQVNELVFPADFYVLDMGDRCDSIILLLGRPFLKISKTKIDVHEVVSNMADVDLLDIENGNSDFLCLYLCLN
ncbi:uncharacterized protein [Spinacia oleracea]|uniref:Aspartic peptidase DDI1-type domain-containing protein n=1 Tax=Spinacia oleracea TaxID=3562 RepID=A0ABM3R8D6_SPIOL|nr:uncharacterized protein LOC130467401 [Spinacia oleracea]